MTNLARVYVGWRVVRDPDAVGGFADGAILDQHGVYHMLMMGHFTPGTVLERQENGRRWRYQVMVAEDGKQALKGMARNAPKWMFSGSLGPSNTYRTGHGGMWCGADQTAGRRFLGRRATRRSGFSTGR